MQKVLLIQPPFWDPVCVPLGISSLKAYAEQFNHHVELIDLNTNPKIFGIQKEYFDEGKRQFPYWKKWNIERNGTEMLAFHQIIYQYAKQKHNYKELVSEILNMNARPNNEFISELNIKSFDDILFKLYNEINNAIEGLLNNYKPDVVGCHLNNSTWAATLFILRSVKELMTDVRTVVGGPGPLMGIASSESEVRTFYDSHEFIDYYVVGEGEKSFTSILNNLELEPGIIDSNKDLSLEEIKKDAININEFPLPTYGNLDVDKYLQLSIASSRGCPFECSFCAETVFWKGFRLDKNIYNKINELAEKYNRSSFYICDSLSNSIMTPLSSEISSNGKSYTLDAYLRADPICTDVKKTSKWYEGGLIRARLGMESASQRILDEMVKMTNPENMEKSLYSLATQGILTSTLWITCYPGETESEFRETLKFIKMNHQYIYQADAWLFQYHPEGMAHTSEIDIEKGTKYRFSSELNSILGVTPYLVKNDMSPEERFWRCEYFNSEMKELSIPNPYTIFEMISAIKRWNNLGHKTKWSPKKSMERMTY